MSLVKSARREEEAGAVREPVLAGQGTGIMGAGRVCDIFPLARPLIAFVTRLVSAMARACMLLFFCTKLKQKAFSSLR